LKRRSLRLFKDGPQQEQEQQAKKNGFDLAEYDKKGPERMENGRAE